MLNHDVLFTPFQINQSLTLKNRIVMAPLTRCKSSDDFVPTREMAEYYARRADAGLIVTEATIIHEEARGHDNVPGIFNQAQIKGWQRVTDLVHKNEGVIFQQVWHVGRVSHPVFLNGKLPISSSETMMTERVSRSNGLHYGLSRAASLIEIQEIVSLYVDAAKNAIKAGFDGIELHGANGYLIDQFLHHHTNKREDEYGGSVENRSRFALEVIKACGEAIGFERLAIRLSPGAYVHEMVGDRKDALVFEYFLKELNQFPLAYIHTGNFDDTKRFPELNDMTMTDFIRQNYQGNVIACGGYSINSAADSIENQKSDLVAIGRPFIANSDFIHKIKNNIPLTNYHVSMLDRLD